MKSKKVLSMVLVVMMVISVILQHESIVKGEIWCTPYSLGNTFHKKANKATKEPRYVELLKEVKSVEYVKSSNEKVLTVKTRKINGIWNIVYTPKNYGKSTITYKYTYKENGKTKTKKEQFTMTLYKYNQPVKVLKIGNKKLAGKYKYSSIVEGKVLKGKLKIEPKNGYVLGHTSIYTKKGEFKDISEGDKIKLKKGDTLQIGFSKNDKYITIMYKVK